MLSDIQLVDRSPAGQILKLLQQQGPLSIKAIEAALGVTATAVRQQLTTLMTAEIVTAETVREKRGRPHAMYRLTEKGLALIDIMEAIKQFGERYLSDVDSPSPDAASVLPTCQ